MKTLLILLALVANFAPDAKAAGTGCTIYSELYPPVQRQYWGPTNERNRERIHQRWGELTERYQGRQNRRLNGPLFKHLKDKGYVVKARQEDADFKLDGGDGKYTLHHRITGRTWRFEVRYNDERRTNGYARRTAFRMVRDMPTCEEIMRRIHQFD